MPSTVQDTIDFVYRTESRRILATLIRLLGDFDLAEEALQDALASALQQWPKDGIPDNPRAWLISTGRFKAIDAMRRRSRFDASLGQIAEKLDQGETNFDNVDGVADDDLRLIFTCCHPALPADARVALTLREVCGLTTEEIARAFLTSPPTIAQRIVRAKSKIRDAGIPYVVPSTADIPERLETVMQVVYLVFNEGYSASFGENLTRADLSGEAIRLGRLVKDLLPNPEVIGLLALMLIQESRRMARVTPGGDLILMEEQDRGKWDQQMISEGSQLVEQALSAPGYGVYTIQAAIAAVHAAAKKPSETDWAQIVALYTVLYQISPTPIVELNRAVAIAMRDGPAAGLALIDAILARGDLSDYHLAHSARADLLRRSNRFSEAREAYQAALDLAKVAPERRFLERRLEQMV